MDERSLPRSPERRYDHIKISNYRRGDAYPPNHAEPIDITIALRQVFLFFSSPLFCSPTKSTENRLLKAIKILQRDVGESCYLFINRWPCGVGSLDSPRFSSPL
jgi:hypothetical protein